MIPFATMISGLCVMQTGLAISPSVEFFLYAHLRWVFICSHNVTAGPKVHFLLMCFNNIFSTACSSIICSFGLKASISSLFPICAMLSLLRMLNLLLLTLIPAPRALQSWTLKTIISRYGVKSVAERVRWFKLKGKIFCLCLWGKKVIF